MTTTTTLPKNYTLPPELQEKTGEYLVLVECTASPDLNPAATLTGTTHLIKWTTLEKIIGVPHEHMQAGKDRKFVLVSSALLHKWKTQAEQIEATT